MLLGEKHFKWTIVGSRKDRRGRTVYEVECECGYRTTKRKEAIVSGTSKRCIECVKKSANNIQGGDVYNDWTVIKEGEPYKYEHRFLCRCKCGKESIIRKFDLKYQKSKQCRSCVMSLRNTTHSGSKSRTYSIWAAMKQRCINPKNKSYQWYGQRGIQFQESWKEYENFVRDMGLAPEGLCIERIDPNGNYCLDNCKWADMKAQSENRRNSYKNRDKFIYAPIEKLCSSCKSLLLKDYGKEDVEPGAR